MAEKLNWSSCSLTELVGGEKPGGSGPKKIEETRQSLLTFSWNPQRPTPKERPAPINTKAHLLITKSLAWLRESKLTLTDCQKQKQTLARRRLHHSGLQIISLIFHKPFSVLNKKLLVFQTRSNDKNWRDIREEKQIHRRARYWNYQTWTLK